MDQTKRELENRLNAPINATSSKEQQRLKSEQNNSLQDFVNMASGLVTRLRTDTDNTQSAFKVCKFKRKTSKLYTSVQGILALCEFHYCTFIKLSRTIWLMRFLIQFISLGTIQVLRHHVFDFFRPTHPPL